MAAFSPVHTVGAQIVEAIMLHDAVRSAASRRARERWSCSATSASRCPNSRVDAYSWQLSGGLRQRAMIAMALSCKPRLLIADEPTTAIDVTTQAQILALLRELQHRYHTAIIFITHDLGVIARDGRLCRGDVSRPHHGRRARSTKSSMRRGIPIRGRCCARSPVCRPRPRSALPVIAGTLPHPFNRPPGCPFHPRCEDILPERCATTCPRTAFAGSATCGELLPAQQRR